MAEPLHEQLKMLLETRDGILKELALKNMELTAVNSAIEALQSVHQPHADNSPSSNEKPYFGLSRKEAMQRHLANSNGKLEIRALTRDLLAMGVYLGKTPVRTISILASTNPEEFTIVEKGDLSIVELGRNDKKMRELKRKRKDRVS